jgi:hypothetical protein
MLRPQLLGLAVAAALSACASSHATPAPTPAGPEAIAAGATPVKAAPRSTRDLLLGPDMVATGVNSTYDAINRLRPIFFTARSTTGGARVMIDDVMRSADDLRILPPAQVDFVRYFDVDDAMGRFGDSQPVIYVVTKGHTPRFPLPRR